MDIWCPGKRNLFYRSVHHCPHVCLHQREYLIPVIFRIATTYGIHRKPIHHDGVCTRRYFIGIG